LSKSPAKAAETLRKFTSDLGNRDWLRTMPELEKEVMSVISKLESQAGAREVAKGAAKYGAAGAGIAGAGAALGYGNSALKALGL